MLSLQRQWKNKKKNRNIIDTKEKNIKDSEIKSPFNIANLKKSDKIRKVEKSQNT